MFASALGEACPISLDPMRIHEPVHLRQFLHERKDRPQLAVDGSRREVLDQAIYRFRLNAKQLRCCAVPAVAVRTRP
jgi:hypothetical protein